LDSPLKQSTRILQFEGSVVPRHVTFNLTPEKLIRVQAAVMGEETQSSVTCLFSCIIYSGRKLSPSFVDRYKYTRPLQG
jgi:hypothetical protein